MLTSRKMYGSRDKRWHERTQKEVPVPVKTQEFSKMWRACWAGSAAGLGAGFVRAEVRGDSERCDGVSRREKKL